jgi:ABC-type transporter Mla subunit MlaD
MLSPAKNNLYSTSLLNVNSQKSAVKVLHVIGEDIARPLSLSPKSKHSNSGQKQVNRSMAPNDFMKSLGMLGPELIDEKDQSFMSQR